MVSEKGAVNCESCEMKFTAPNFYIQHHQATHGSLPPDYLGKELFMCDSCPNIFISKQSLTVHIINVHKDLDKGYLFSECHVFINTNQSGNSFL